MTIESLARKKDSVEMELKKLLFSDDTALSQAMEYAVLSGGKRFRPLLAISSAEIFKVKEETALPFACALEFIHNYSLVHDDLPAMDDDSERRGKPTCHKAFGEDVAILAGDALLTLAFEVMADASLGDQSLPIKKQCILELSRAAGSQGMVRGQWLDISLSGSKPTEDQMLELMEKKTGELITVAVRIGGILGNADREQMRALTGYGKKVGLAFQIRDDILDAEEDTDGCQPVRPNSVDLWGPEEAHQKLQDLIRDSIGSLRRSGIASDDLILLAEQLLDVKGDRRNG